MKKLCLMVVGLFLCLATYAECYIVEGEKRSGDTKSAGSVIGSEISFNGKQTEDGYISYTAKTTRGDGLNIKIQYYAGSQWKDIKTQKITNRDASYNCTIPSADRSSATKIRFINVDKYYALGISYTNTISNICVRKTDVKSLALNGTAQFATKAGFGKAEQLSTSITLDAVNLSGQALSVSCTNPDNGNYFSVSATQINVSNSDCEGVASVTLYFNTTTETPAGDYNTTVKFSHTSSGKSIQVPVVAHVTEALISTIKWDQSFTSLLSINNPAPIYLNATVVDKNGPVDGATIVYTSADPSVVSIAGNVLTIVGDGRTTITATYTSDDEEVRTSAFNTKQVFVSDGSVCSTFLVNETSKVSLNGYAGTKSYSWTAPAVSTFSFELWKQTAGTQDAKVVCKDANGNTLATYNYENNKIPTKATLKTEVLPAGTKKLEFSSTGTLDKYFRNISVEQATYLEKKTTDLGNVSNNNSANATVNFKYSNLPTPISASLEGESEIAVSATPVGSGCGDWNDNASINLVFTPKTTGQRQYTYTGNVVLSAGANAGLKTIKIPVSITIDMPFGNLNNGFAMVYNAQELLLGGATQAYIAQWVEGTMLNLVSVLQEVDGDGKKHLAPETPALLYNDNDEEDFYTYKVEVNPTLAPNLGTSNAFTYTGGSFQQDNDTYNYYVLGANAGGEVAFYKYTGTIPSGKVVLVWEKLKTAAAAPQRIEIRMAQDVATALVPVWAENEQTDDSRFDGRIYTIMGVPVSSMSHPGIYIQNGKKIIVDYK